jgi:hypothetical protein
MSSDRVGVDPDQRARIVAAYLIAYRYRCELSRQDPPRRIRKAARKAERAARKAVEAILPEEVTWIAVEPGTGLPYVLSLDLGGELICEPALVIGRLDGRPAEVGA